MLYIVVLADVEKQTLMFFFNDFAEAMQTMKADYSNKHMYEIKQDAEGLRPYEVLSLQDTPVLFGREILIPF
jgi:hypothetical protein